MNNNLDLQQVADRINLVVSANTFYDNLTEIELFENKENHRKSLFLYWSSFVTTELIKEINDELGTNIKMVFVDSNNRLNTIVNLMEVIQ